MVCWHSFHWTETVKLVGSSSFDFSFRSILELPSLYLIFFSFSIAKAVFPCDCEIVWRLHLCVWMASPYVHMLQSSTFLRKGNLCPSRYDCIKYSDKRRSSQLVCASNQRSEKHISIDPKVKLILQIDLNILRHSLNSMYQPCRCCFQVTNSCFLCYHWSIFVIEVSFWLIRSLNRYMLMCKLWSRHSLLSVSRVA